MTDDVRFLREKKDILNLAPMGLNHAQNVFLCHFLEFESLVFLEVEYSDSLQQCLTSSGGNIHKIIGKGANLGPKIGFFLPFSKFGSLVFLIVLGKKSNY